MIRDRLRDFITTNFYVPDPERLGNDVSLLEQGVIDSTGVLEVITFVEESFGIRIEDREMLPDNLESIDRITAFVERKLLDMDEDQRAAG